MDLGDFHSNSSAQLQNMKATMNALRSQLDQEKEMLKNDIVQTLKCKTMLGTGSADLLYTSGLLARLKSLEDNREPPSLDHAGTTSAYCLKGRDEDEKRKFSGAGEVFRPVHPSEGSCVRHCCSLKFAEAPKITSNVEMHTFSGQKFPPPPTFGHHNRDFSLPTVEEDSDRMMPERRQPQPNNSWSGDATYIYPVPKDFPNSYHDLQYNYRLPDSSYNQFLQQPSCQCVPYRMPSFGQRVQETQENRPDSRNRHCTACCTRKIPAVTQSALAVPPAELRYDESRRCRIKSPQCRHGSTLHHCSPENSPRQDSNHYHQKSSRQNKRHNSKKESRRSGSVSKSVVNEATVTDFDKSQQVKSGHTVGTQVEEQDKLIEIHRQGTPSIKPVNVTPRSSSPGSTHSGKTRETLRYGRPGEGIPGDIIDYHYTNELSSQKSDGSSLFGSEIALDDTVDPLTCDQKRPKVRSIKPRRRGAKRSSGNQGTDKSGRATHPPSGVERSKSTPHPLHCRLADVDSGEKAPSETATTDLTKGRGKERLNHSASNKTARRSTKQPPLEHTIQLPAYAQSVPRKKKILKNDPLKPLETFYASLSALPRSKSKRSDRSDDRELETKVSELYRKKSLKTLRPPNPFSVILEELRSSPMLRNMSISTGKKFV